jgi:nucleoside-diphosphate-sugar epimerase
VSAPVVVFGAAGSLGRRVLAAMPPEQEVIGVDLNLEPVCDVASPRDLAGLLERLPARLIAVNVTGVVSVGESPHAIASLVRSNVQGPAVLVGALAERLEHFVHLSSISVYGPPRVNPMTEEHPLDPDTPYGITKSAGERLVRAGCARAGVPLTVVRATQLFGLPSAHETLPHVLTGRVCAGEAPELRAAPTTRRDYLHVDDAARLIVSAALRPRAGTFNAGSGGGVALGELFATAYEAVGRHPPVTPGDGPDSSQWLDSGAARAAFDWEPRQSVLDWVAAVAAGQAPDAELLHAG